VASWPQPSDHFAFSFAYLPGSRHLNSDLLRPGTEFLISCLWLLLLQLLAVAVAVKRATSKNLVGPFLTEFTYIQVVLQRQVSRN
jgi:hypothetical protein